MPKHIIFNCRKPETEKILKGAGKKTHNALQRITVDFSLEIMKVGRVE